MIDHEDQLSTQWLNLRESYDTGARNASLLQAAITQLADTAVPVISDLGSGTGNNILFLLNKLPCSAKFRAIEQHNHLSEEFHRRLQQHYDITVRYPGCVSVHSRGLSFEVEFINQNLLSWLDQHTSSNLYTASALFDLLTQNEIEQVIDHVARSATPLYSTLNYSGIEFIPGAVNDHHFVSLFESNMCRPLARGRPLGRTAFEAIATQVQLHSNLTITSERSDWVIPASATDFLTMNMEFYHSGITAQLPSPESRLEFEQWMQHKRAGISAGIQALQVHHQDFLITHD